MPFRWKDKNTTDYMDYVRKNRDQLADSDFELSKDKKYLKPRFTQQELTVE
jgi:hypothetical protein